MKTEKHHTIWTTENELGFIRNMGIYSAVTIRHRIHRKALLEGYLLGISKRDNWDRLSKPEIGKCVLKELEKENKKCQKKN